MEIYFDKFNAEFTNTKDEFAAPERYVHYTHDNGTGELSEIHITDNSDYVTFRYKAEETADFLKLDKKRVKFLESNGCSGYDSNPHKYYTTEMVIPKSEYDKIVARIEHLKQK